MIKKNLKMMIITSVVILIPMIAGIILWNKLPDVIATHWGMNNDANGFSSKAVTVFGLPVFLLALHWICMLITSIDPKKENISQKLISMVLWICPSLSILMGAIVYAMALGKKIEVGLVVIAFLGILFIIMGNLMPKAKKNHSFGVRTPWALEDEENWTKTHRFAGVLWVIGGVIITLTSFLQSPILFICLIVPMVLAPTAYSYLYYRKKNKK